FQHIKALRSLTADVTRQMSITGATRREVSKALLERAMDVPGFQFIDKAGTNWPLKSYFNTLARTELMNAAPASYDDKVTDEGFDVMKLTTSGHCCEKCARFEGRLFSLTGATKGLPSKDDLIEAGVFHPNCTHSYSLVPDYIRERDYTLGGKKNSSGEQREEARYKGQLLVGAGNKSTEVFIASKDMSGDDLQQHQTAVNAIGKVHSLGAMPEIPVLRKKAHPEFPNAAGQCVTDANGNPVEILIFDASTHKAFTEIHEMGHALDDFMKFTKSRLSDGVFDAIDCSRGKIELEELFDKFFGEKREMLEYLLRSDEIFARAYSQYIASRSGDATLLSQLNSSRRGVIFYGGLWEDDDFAPIAEEFDKMLKKVGMIR
ncbi:MAG: hypothetical protein J6Y54_06780, partial [Lentisphaeria bacterium]|nr:hypothetical protein [Lentisphaeria bacterium]